jgi:uncharacterized membrane protein
VKPINWFGIIILYTVLTLLCVYFIPSESIFSVVRIILGFIFVAVVPGYCLVTFLFQEGKLDLGEKAVLSVALSFSLAGISGLFLGLSPIGINFTSITESLSGIVIVLAILAFLRKTGLIKLQLRKLRTQNPAQITS